MQLHFSNFVSARSRFDLSHQLSGISGFPSHLHHCLLSGPERSGKTSLLLHCAFSMAKTGRTVLLLCDRKKLEQVPPLLPEGVQQCDPAWQRVHIKYIACGNHLLRYAASLHLSDALPDAILVDDLHLYLNIASTSHNKKPPPRDMIACKLMAVLHDAVDYVSREKGDTCFLIATETGGAEGPRSLYLSQRWFPLVLSIRALGGRFLLHALPTQEANARILPGWQAEYSLRQQCPCLEALLRC